MPSFFRAASLIAAVMVAGCVGPQGETLVPGQSTVADVVANMGPPGEGIAAADGSKIWFYPRGPVGQETYAVRLDENGVVLGVAQTLTVENVHRIQSTKDMTAAGIRALLGPPNKVIRFERQQRDAWEYRMVDVNWKVLTVQFSDDGIVREVIYADDPTEHGGRDVGGECLLC